MKTINIKNILNSLRADVLSGKITLHDAAEELHESGWKNFIDEDAARRLLRLQPKTETRKGEPTTKPDSHALAEGCKILVHLYNPNSSREIKTRNYNKPFTVRREAGRLGIDRNTERSPYTCGGDIFAPFHTFAPSVIFEDIETGARFHFDNLTESVQPLD